jgi:protein-S-isoprenylcysteine O-methyltransferase Ste14
VKKTLLFFRWFGAATWISLAGLRLASAWRGEPLTSLLLAGQCGLAGWLLVVRREPKRKVSSWRMPAAWLSALLPLGLRIQRETLPGQVVLTMGLLLVLWSMRSLGNSFGIAPADRGLVKKGPYRFLRHPMYLGELVSLAGAVLSSLCARNLVLLMFLILSLLLRIRWEEQVIDDYSGYARQVRWRIIPLIW